MERGQQGAAHGDHVPRMAGEPEPTDSRARARAAEQIFQCSTGFIISRALHVAVALGIPELLAERPQDAAQLSQALKTDPAATRSLLRTLAEVGIFQEQPDGLFGLTEAGSLLRADAPVSLRPFVCWIANAFHFRTYTELLTSVQTGHPAVEAVFGAPLYDLFKEDLQLAATFNSFMTVFADGAVTSILDAYDFSAIDTLIDLGGAHGHLLTSILARYPAVNGIVFDIEPMLDGARSRLQREGLADRCQAVTGNFFVEVPPGDAYLMKHILRDWSDEEALIILRNVRAALGGTPGGRLLVIETMAIPGAEGYLSERIALEMLTIHGGRTRTPDDFRLLLSMGGFEVSRVVPLKSGLCLMEAQPR
jgi:hypothetical protein